ncbi:enoyl-CoA hydratase/isomerase family protein [Halioxenophilus sp. WMMB6]|uniref:enoyl-CoA hydratase/isomerase family protein n=1 Tax=Halioxenophilus sp. WMMB6 TaxID=3073815 RepID=UPI00295E512B|nr:enoyl-CoA hydratase/isomerase family protein [Halioxenophilus sp. WMMB6]
MPTASDVQILAVADLPAEPEWLALQSTPVVAYGDQAHINADVIVADEQAAVGLAEKIATQPQASLVLVQVLRAGEHLSANLALDLESLAFATLQGGGEFAAWLAGRNEAPAQVRGEGPAVLLARSNNELFACLNRPQLRNSITVEMREALVEALELLLLDDSLTKMILSGLGDCFSVGGELREFGTALDPATAHWVRTVQSPARLLARASERLECWLHGACIGSGLELPAFAKRVVAHPKTFFQLPELQLGLIPGAGGTVSISRRIGRQRTAWMALSGRRVNAKTALAWGLVDELTSPDWVPPAP